MYLDCVIMILEAFLFTSRPINFLNNPISIMEKSMIKYDLISLNPIVEPPVMRNSSTYKIVNGKKPPFYSM